MLTWDEAVKATGGTAALGDPAHALTSVTTDSRHMEAGGLFVCLSGPTFDGHSFAGAALQEGAYGIVARTDAKLEVPAGTPVIRVEDPLRALGDVARAWRRAAGIPVIAVTGSSGKTSTKEMLAAYLNKGLSVLKTEANYNNEIGVPLTLLSIRPEHRVAVVEMGMRAPGEIAYLTQIAEPTIAIVTNVGTAHIGLLGSREAIAAAKAEIWHHMPVGGTAIVPFDDAAASLEAGRWGGRIVTWSLTDPVATVWAHDVRSSGAGQAFTVYWKGGRGMKHGRAEIRLRYWGDHHRANALIAIAAGWAMGYAPAPRLELRPDALPGRAGQLDLGGVFVTDDAYNANPESVRAALKAFAEVKGEGRRVALLGDMAELGAHAEAEHLGVGAYAATLGLDEIVALGELAKLYCVEGATRCTHYLDAEAACDHLASQLRPGDRLLLKASRAGRFELVLQRLAARMEGRQT